MNKLIFLFLFVVSEIFCADILIITHSYNMPSFIRFQYECFKKFLADDFEYVVFNDATNPQLEDEINNVCKELEIRCIRVPQQIHKKPERASKRHADCIQYSLDLIGYKHAGYVFLADSDVFLVKPFNLSQYMENFDIACHIITKQHIYHLWPVIIFMNMDNLPHKETINWNPGIIDNIGIDTAGHTYHYFKNNPHLQIRYLENRIKNHSLLCKNCKNINNYSCNHNKYILRKYKFDKITTEFLRSGIPNVEFILNNSFFHVQGISYINIKYPEEYNLKLKLVPKYLHDVLSA